MHASEGLQNCTICLSAIDPKTIHEEEKEQKLDCSHVFHRECIGEWLKRKHNCPLCREKVKVLTPEAPQPEMTREEILAVPDHQAPIQELSIDEMLRSVRAVVLHGRTIRQLDEATPVAETARKINSVAARIFGW